MVLIRGVYEIWELKASILSCVALFIANCNVLPVHYLADLPSTLITISSVMLLHHFRVENIAPVHNLWQFFLELVLFYICNQIIIVLIWEQFCYLLDILEDRTTSRPIVLNAYQKSPNSLFSIRHNTVYIIKLLVAVAITYSSVKWTLFLDYVLPWRRYYNYFYNPWEIADKKKVARSSTRARSASKPRTRSRSKSKRRGR